jgi:hypothetical protein
MPIAFIRGITAPERTDSVNRWLGCTLAFVAGATNAAGLLAVGQYSSQMSGLVSSIADNAIHWDIPRLSCQLGVLWRPSCRVQRHRRS